MIFESPSNSFEWMIFLAQKYSSMFAKGTWLTLYIAVAGTLLGFVLQKQKKPSIRAQLAAAKEEQKKKPPAREKSKEMEV